MARLWIPLCALGLTPIAWAQEPLVANPSFEEGDTGPTGWTLTGQGSWETGGHTGERCIRATGAGEDETRWRMPVALEPRGVYRVSFWARRLPGAAGGLLVTGPEFANRDFAGTTEWQRYSFAFRVPEDQPETTLHFGQWYVTGSVEYDDIELTRVVPLHVTVDGVELGVGEHIANGRYSAAHDLAWDGSTSCRFLDKQGAGFNSHRWLITTGSEVIYRHQLPGCEFTSATADISVGHYTGGTLIVEASVDGQEWLPAGSADSVTSVACVVPARLLPADVVYVRLRFEPGVPEPGGLQVYGYRFDAILDQAPQPSRRGGTQLWEVIEQAPNLPLKLSALSDPTQGELTLGLDTPPGGAPIRVNAELEFLSAPAPGEAGASRQTGPATTFGMPLPWAGDYAIELRLSAADDGAPLLRARTTATVADLHDTSYGGLLRADSPIAAWWCESPRKVSLTRALPQGPSEAAEVRMARNEYEAVQIVLRPDRDIPEANISVTDLSSPDGTISAADVEVCRVAYLPVETPSDSSSTPGDWPDPLPPISGPIALEADRNQPLWVTVHTQPDTPPGDYRGALVVEAQGSTLRLPIAVHVYALTLPEETHVASCFGLSPGNIFRYHNLTNPEDQQRVWDLYMRNFAAHRISPIDPMALAPYTLELSGGSPWEGPGEIVADVDGVMEGRNCLHIADNATDSVPTETHRPLIDIDPGVQYTLAWSEKTGRPGQRYTVTLNTFDHTRQWISGHNIDFVQEGTGEWQRHMQLVPQRFDARARFVQINLRPTEWTEQGENTGEAWFDDITFGEVNGPNMVEDNGFERVYTPDDIEIKLDFTAFDNAAARYLDEFGMTAFCLNLQGMGGGTFHSRYLGNLGGYQQGTPEYERLFSRYLGAVEAHLREKGWLDKAYTYWFDEPEPRDYDFVKDGMALLKRAGPGIRRLLTEEVTPDLTGFVDIWCPLTPNYEEQACEARQAEGDRIWWYVCTGPKAPYCGLFIDHSAIEMRMWLWQTWQANVQGVLVWATNYWTSECAYPAPSVQNPWTDPMGWVSGYSTPIGAKVAWGNGDGRFVYPPNTDPEDTTTPYISGPVNSIRWEMLRDGMEDYEYFWLLRDTIERARARGADADAIARAEALLEVPARATRSLTEFTREPMVLLTHREMIARAIEGLSGD